MSTLRLVFPLASPTSHKKMERRVNEIWNEQGCNLSIVSSCQ